MEFGTSPLDSGGSSIPTLSDGRSTNIGVTSTNNNDMLRHSTSVLSTLSVLPSVDSFPDPKRSRSMKLEDKLHRMRGLAALHLRDMVHREMELEKERQELLHPPVGNPPRGHARRKLEEAFARAREHKRHKMKCVLADHNSIVWRLEAEVEQERLSRERRERLAYNQRYKSETYTAARDAISRVLDIVHLTVERNRFERIVWPRRRAARRFLLEISYKENERERHTLIRKLREEGIVSHDLVWHPRREEMVELSLRARVVEIESGFEMNQNSVKTAENQNSTKWQISVDGIDPILGTSYGLKVPLPEEMWAFVDTSVPAKPCDAVRVLSRYKHMEDFFHSILSHLYLTRSKLDRRKLNLQWRPVLSEKEQMEMKEAQTRKKSKNKKRSTLRKDAQGDNNVSGKTKSRGKVKARHGAKAFMPQTHPKSVFHARELEDKRLQHRLQPPEVGNVAETELRQKSHFRRQIVYTHGTNEAMLPFVDEFMTVFFRYARADERSSRNVSITGPRLSPAGFVAILLDAGLISKSPEKIGKSRPNGPNAGANLKSQQTRQVAVAEKALRVSCGEVGPSPARASFCDFVEAFVRWTYVVRGWDVSIEYRTESFANLLQITAESLVHALQVKSWPVVEQRSYEDHLEFLRQINSINGCDRYD